jgi:hypothetical protein
VNNPCHSTQIDPKINIQSNISKGQSKPKFRSMCTEVKGPYKSLNDRLVLQRLNSNFVFSPLYKDSNIVFSPLYKDIQRQMIRLKLYEGLKILFCELNSKQEACHFHCRLEVSLQLRIPFLPNPHWHSTYEMLKPSGDSLA